MKFTVNLPDDLHARLKRLATEERRSMNAVVVSAVDRYLTGHGQRVWELAG